MYERLGGLSAMSRRPSVRSKAPGSPRNGRAITRPTACSPVMISRAAAQAAYSSAGGTTSTCAAICSTESADV